MADVMERQPLLSTEELAAYLGVSRKTLYNWRSRRIGPQAYKAGGGLRYRLNEVNAWLREPKTAA